MNELLLFIIQHFSFLYDCLGARFVDSLAAGIDALLILQLPELRLRFVRDRAQIFLEFQGVHHATSDEWFSFDIVQQLITGVVNDDDAVMSGTLYGDFGERFGDLTADYKKALRNAEFLKTNIAEIQAAFAADRLVTTEKTLHEFEEARAKRIFG